jgi:hypothetical protein
MKKGKCVYKKNQDGSQGKKVGCTKGSVEDYLKALYANADGETKKENKSMKMKKSELLALIKEEIVKEMYDDFMLDDEYDGQLPPEGVVDDDTREEMEQTDQIISMAYSLAGSGEAAKRLLQKCIGLIDNYEEARLSQFDDDDDDDDMLQEGMDAESAKIVADAVQKIAPLIGVMSLPVLIGLIYEQLKNMGAK